jgi:hypothetical protein
MAQAPRLKVYAHDGEYVASCKYYEDAAILVGHYPPEAKVRKGHNGKTLWHEGHEADWAANSIDRAANTMRERDI